jgi:uncharacterized membrane protein
VLAIVVKQFRYTIVENSLFENMNHKKMTLSIAAIVAAVAITAVAFAVPQQAVASGHHNHNSNSIKVDQQISQLNACTNSSFCQNDASNNADIHR